MNIKGKLITLRAIEYEDLDFMRSMLNDQEIEDQVVGWSFPVSRYMQNKWFEGQLENKDNMRFIIGNRQIMMRPDIKLPQPFASWSNSL